MRRFWPIFFIVALAGFFALPLFQPGYIPTHDGEFSIIRIWQYAKMLKSGYLLPRWAPDLNSGYGIPLFTFYYPLPYLVGSVLHFAGLSYVNAFKITLGLSYVLASVLCFTWLSKLFSRLAATVGTIFFMTVPYWFVNLYVRGSVGEVMAVLFLIAALAAVEHERPKLLALATAALILSHNIAAVIFLPLLIGFTLLRKKRFIYTIVWGMGLSAFFWLPALVEQPYVLGLSNFDFRDHFPGLAQLLIPSWGTGFSQPGWPAGEMSQQLGVGVVSLLLLAGILVWQKYHKLRRLLIAGLGLGFIAVLLMLEVSLPIWQSLSFLHFLQYPWRLLGLFMPISAFLGAYIAERAGRLAVIGGIISLILVIPYIRPVVYPPRSDDYYLARREFTDGTTTVGNSFSTQWLTWQKERPSQRFEVVSGKASIAQLESQPITYSLRIEAQVQSLVKANLSYYPGWEVSIDNIAGTIEEVKGLIYFSLPAGTHTVVVSFRETPLRAVSNALSVLSLFWLVISAILERRYAHRSRYFAHSHRA